MGCGYTLLGYQPEVKVKLAKIRKISTFCIFNPSRKYQLFAFLIHLVGQIDAYYGLDTFLKYNHFLRMIIDDQVNCRMTFWKFKV